MAGEATRGTPLATALATLALMALVGCSDKGSGSPGTDASTAAAPGALTVETLFSRMPVPSLCGHQPVDLVNGRLPWTDPDFGGITAFRDRTVFGDLTGDGRDDAAVVVDCNAGGVSWGAQVLGYTLSDAGEVTLLGHVAATEIQAPGIRGDRPLAESLEIDSGGIQTRVLTQMKGDASCCPSLPIEVELRWDQRADDLVIEEVVTHLDHGTVSRVLQLRDDLDWADEEQPAAIAERLVTDLEVLHRIAEYVDVALDPEVVGCADDASDLDWSPDDDAKAALDGDGATRYCLVTGKQPGIEVLAVALAQRGDAWTVVGAADGQAR